MSRLILTSFSLLAACSGGGSSKHMPDAPVKDIGFNKPTASLKANMEVSNNNWTEIGAADLSCLNTASTDKPTTVAVMLSTEVDDFQTGAKQPNAMVTAFKDIDVTHPFDTKTADATDAKLTVAIPVGTTRFGFKMTGSGILDTLLLNQIVKPDMATQMLAKIQSVSTTTAQTLPALIGVSRTVGTGVLAGAMRDCQAHEMSNFVATVSSTKDTPTTIDGSDAYYFSPSAGVPVRHGQQEASSKDGLFMVIELPPTATAYVQIWGYPTDADLAADQLKLVAQLATPVVGDTVITGSYEPLRK